MKMPVAIALTVFAAAAARAQQSQPLCIIDGVRHPSSDCSGGVTVWPSSPISATGRVVLNGMNIAHVEIVKGPAAMTQYGPDAANGVIVVTTRMGAGTPVPPGDDPLARFLFPPELVMAHQQEINLTDRQRSAIQEAMKEELGKFIDMHFQMTGEVQKLQRIVQGTTVDEPKMLEQLDHVLGAEKEIKHAQLTLMIRIKNQLTEQQQTALAKLRP
jgi:TonB-dependent SusC/RagA subfamily outer membrane receptor